MLIKPIFVEGLLFQCGSTLF